MAVELPPRGPRPPVDGWMAATWEAVASTQIRLQSDLTEHAGMQEVFEAIRPFLHELCDFGAMGLVSISEDRLGVEVEAVDAEVHREAIQAELLHHIGEGAFAWSLYQNRPVIVRGGPLGPWTVLHTLATPSCAIGMFMGSLPPSAPFLPHAAHTALSIVLMNCAGVLESASLHRSLLEHAGSLERKVAERTVDLGKSEAAAQRANRVKSEFLANMSHEMRTPLNGIVGMASLLETTPLDGEQREQVGVIRRSADDLVHFINDLLDSSKAEAGQLTIENVRFDLHEVVEEIINLLAPRAIEKRVELLLHYHPEAPRSIRGDPTRIKQAVANLVGNAIKFTEDGRIVVKVAAAEDGLLRISVEDTGIGIDPEHVERIFDAFVQADSSTTRRFGGTGLGLAIGKSLAELMRGSLEVESRLGQGSTFHFSFRPFEIDEVSGADSPDVSSECFLVVSDRPEIAENVSSMVAVAGGTVVRGSSLDGAALLDEATSAGWSGRTLVLDCGWDPSTLRGFVHEVRAAAPRVRIIGLTPYRDRDESQSRESEGYDELVQRPIREKQLYDALTGRRRHATIAESVEPLAPARVLVADDNPVNLAVARGMLERLGVGVHQCTNGQEAVQALADERFDVILMDCQMPIMDGYDATRLIRQSGNEVPIIALTASARPEDAQRSRDSGMDHHLTKPLTLEKLRSALARWLPSRPEAGDVAQALLPEIESPVAGAPAAFDLEVVLESTGGDVGLILEVSGLFLQTQPEVMEMIRRARWAEDAHELARVAHRIKGGALNIGAARLAEIAGRAELTWLREDLADVDVRIGLLTRAYDDFRAAMEAFRRERDS